MGKSGGRRYGTVSPTLIGRHQLSPRNETGAPACSENGTPYVAIEISRTSWVVGIKSPVNERVALHTTDAGDVDALPGLIERRRARAEPF